MRRYILLKITHTKFTACFATIGLLLASSASGQSRPADFGNQWVRNNPFTLGGYFSHDPNPPFGNGDPVLFANSGLNTVHDLTMPSANAHLLLQMTEIDAGSVQNLINRKVNHPNITGWLIYDEPTEDLFPGIANVVSALKQSLPDDLIYLNFGGASGTPASFRQHLDNALTIIQPDVLSYDEYPFRTFGSRLYPYFYESMMIVREKAQQYNVPYFATMQSYDDPTLTYVMPTVTEYRVLASSYLTAGFKGLWHWQYQASNLDNSSVGAILDQTGAPTALYPVVAAVNAEVKNIGRSLTHLTSTDVSFIPGGINATPAGLKHWTPPNVISNGNMESGGSATSLPSGWVIEADGGFKGVSSDTPNGLGQSLFLDNTSGDAVGHNVFLPIDSLSPNEDYELSFYYKGNLRVATSGFNNNLSDSLNPVTDWTFFSTVLTTDTDAVTLETLKFFDLNSGVGDAPLLIDDVALGAPRSDPHLLSITSTDGADGLIGSFRDDADQPYFMLTNLRHGQNLSELETAGTFDLVFDPSINEIYRLNRNTGEIDTISLVNHTLSGYVLEGGHGDLFNYNGVFVGVPEPSTGLLVVLMLLKIGLAHRGSCNDSVNRRKIGAKVTPLPFRVLR